MKVELKPDEQKQLNSAVNSNQVRKWLKVRDTLKFEVGDVLIKLFRRYEDSDKIKWVPENIASNTKMPQRYVYIFEDEEGIGYFKKLLLSNGTLGKELFSITDFDFESTRFEVDPEYAEHTLLDAEFDIKELRKKALEGRKIATKMNRKMGKKLSTLKEINDFLEQFKVGDTFYTTSDFTGRYQNSYKIDKLEKVETKTLNADYRNYSWERFRDKNKGAVDTTYTYKVHYTGNYGKEERYLFDYMKYIFYTQQPAQEEKK